MKEKPMGDVLKKTPEQHAAEESRQNAKGGIAVIRSGQVQKITHDGDVHAPDDQRVRFGQHFQKIVLEQSGLPFIVDFFELHGAKISKTRFLRTDTE
jgi:hypothetical protein